MWIGSTCLFLILLQSVPYMCVPSTRGAVFQILADPYRLHMCGQF